MLAGILLRVITIALTIASFIPQSRKIIANADSSGISLYYLLFNLIVATHQFFYGVYFYLYYSNESSPLIHGEHPSVLEWLNFGQFIAGLLCFLGLFILCVIYSPNSIIRRITVISIYIVVVLLYVAPYVIITIFEGSDDSKRFFMALCYHWAIFSGTHIITALGIVSLFFQWPHAASLDPLGLFLQAAVFLLVAISWMLLISHYDLVRGVFYLWPKDWYYLKGFAIVDNVVFAAVQAVLYYKVRRGAAVPGSETEPLLGSAGGSGS